MGTKKNNLKFLLCLCGVCLLFCFSYFNQNYNYISFFDLFKNTNCSNFCIILKENSLNSSVLSQATNIIKTNNKDFVYFDYPLTNEDVEDVDYFQIEINNSKNNIIDYLYNFGAELIYEEKFENEQVTYLYLPMLCRYKYIDGKKVNIQLVARFDNCLVGYPMIYTAY